MNSSTLHALAAFPQQLEAFYESIPAAYKHWAPPSWEGIPSERFTAIEQVCHVRDIEIEGYHLRFRRPLVENNPTLEFIDGYRFAGIAITATPMRPKHSPRFARRGRGRSR